MTYATGPRTQPRGLNLDRPRIIAAWRYLLHPRGVVLNLQLDIISPMHGGEIIREARRRAGLSQQDLADRLGTTQSVITRWETGRRSPTFETVIRAVRACGLELSVTLGAPDPDHDLFIRENRRLTPAERLQRMTAQQAGVEEILASSSPKR